jgi:hypothetical protein
MVKVEGRGKYKGKIFYLNATKSPKTGVMLYYFATHKKHAVDKIPKGRKVEYNSRGFPYLGS